MKNDKPDIKNRDNRTDEEWEGSGEDNTRNLREESVWFRRRMNRLFRERCGIMKIPHPEVDTVYERVRSRIVRFFMVVADRIKKLFFAENK